MMRLGFLGVPGLPAPPGMVRHTWVRPRDERPGVALKAGPLQGRSATFGHVCFDEAPAGYPPSGV